MRDAKVVDLDGMGLGYRSISWHRRFARVHVRLPTVPTTCGTPSGANRTKQILSLSSPNQILDSMQIAQSMVISKGGSTLVSSVALPASPD